MLNVQPASTETLSMFLCKENHILPAAHPCGRDSDKLYTEHSRLTSWLMVPLVVNSASILNILRQGGCLKEYGQKVCPVDRKMGISSVPGVNGSAG